MVEVAAPLLMTNLACEMVFVLHQRLCAQNVSDVKRQRVLRDILRGFLDRHFLTELFTPQPLCTPSVAKAVFKKLAHMSIMKLNDASMSKLFDLMMMVCKYHALHCQDPAQLLQITARHLEEVESLMGEEEIPELGSLRSRLEDTYGDLSAWSWHQLWMSLLGFFQDRKVKVSVLLKLGVQKSNGKILLPVAQDGDSRNHAQFMTYNAKGELIADQQIEVPVFRVQGSRPRNAPSVELGTNLYLCCSKNETSATATSTEPPPPTVLMLDLSMNSWSVLQERVAQEKRFLSSLLSANARTRDEEVTLELDLEEEQEPLKEMSVRAINTSEHGAYERQLSRFAEALDTAEDNSAAQASFEDELLAVLDDL